MKKMLLNFAEGMLSREQMRVIKGGDYYDGYGEARCYTISYDVNGGCGNMTESSYYNPEDVDAVATYNMANSNGSITGYNITPCLA